jgi:hypothetical protein
VNEPVLHAVSPKDKQNITKENKAEQSLQPDRSQQLALQNSDSKQPSNNLPEPDHNPNVIDPGKDPIAVLNPPPSKEILTVQPQKIDPAIVTTTNLEPSDPVEHPSNKGFRGFLRKVTRTFEKKTKIKATDDDDRLLIAGVALKLN